MKKPTDTDRINYLEWCEREKLVEENAKARARGEPVECGFFVLPLDGIGVNGNTFREAVDAAIEQDEWEGKQP